MPTENGYSNQKKKGTAQFKTIHDLGSSRQGTAVTTKALYDITIPAGLVSISPILGSNGQIEFYNLEITAHGLPSNNLGVVKFTSGALSGWEIPVERVIDVDNIYVLPIFDTLPSPADLVKSMGWVTSKADSDGNLNFSPGPTQYIYDGLTQQVIQDNTNAANNRALPSLVTYIEDGVQIPVLEDTVTPANNKPLPVKLTGVTGDVIINAGDLSVSIVSTNDSVAIGDPVTGLSANVTTNATSSLEELHIRDDDANTTLSSIDSELATLNTVGFATETTLALLEAKDFATETTLALIEAKDFATQTSLAAVETAVELIDDVVNQDGNPAGTAGVMIGGKDSNGDFQQVSVNTAGELSVTFGAAGFATETTLSALNNKIANDFGASSGAVRSASQIGNATGAADFNSGADSAQTLRVSANLKRSGNELSYNTGAEDANTLRTVLATRHEAAATPLAVHLSNGSAFLGNTTINGASQYTFSTTAPVLKTAAVVSGWDGTLHREVKVDTTGSVQVKQSSALFDDQTQLVTNSVVVTFTPPAGATRMVISNNADATNADRIRFTASANTPSWSGTTRGQILGVGSFTSELPAGAFKVLAESGTAEVSVSWF